MKVTVYSANNCKYCKLAKLFLDANGVKHDYLNIDENDKAKAEFDELGGMGAPLLVVDGEVFRGFTPEIQGQIAEKLEL